MAESKSFHNKLPMEVIELVLMQLTHAELKTSSQVSPMWNSMVSSSKTFLDSTDRKFPIEGSRAAQRCGMKFGRSYKTLSVGQKGWWGSKLENEQIEKLKEFSSSLTHVNIDKIRIKKGALKNFLAFLGSCKNLKELHVSHLKNDFKYQPGQFLAILSPNLRRLVSTSSDWILGHLQCCEGQLDSLEIVRKRLPHYNEGSKPKDKICYFLNSLKKLRMLTLDSVDLDSEEIELRPSCNWEILRFNDDKAPYFTKDTNCMVNWKNLMEASNDDAEMCVNFKVVTQSVVKLLNIVANYSNVTKLGISCADQPFAKDVDKFAGLEVNSNIECMRVGLVFDHEPTEHLESFLERYKNLRYVDFDRDLFRKISRDRVARLLKNVQVLKISTMSARTSKIRLPSLTTLELRVLYHQDLDQLKQFCDINSTITTLKVHSGGNRNIIHSVFDFYKNLINYATNVENFGIVVSGEKMTMKTKSEIENHFMNVNEEN